MSLQSRGFPSIVKTPSVVSAEVPDVSRELILSGRAVHGEL